jgi:hypothetical protein
MNVKLPLVAATAKLVAAAVVVAGGSWAVLLVYIYYFRYNYTLGVSLDISNINFNKCKYYLG